MGLSLVDLLIVDEYASWALVTDELYALSTVSELVTSVRVWEIGPNAHNDGHNQRKHDKVRKEPQHIHRTKLTFEPINPGIQ